jgi:hypothetical protein
VTTVFDVVEEGGKPWLVMERVAARSVQDLLDEQGPLAPAAVARIGLDVLAALEAAHRAGIVHRDVKPANVLVEPDGHARLTDFGIATTTGDSSLTGGALIGSPSYMAPERVNGEEPQGPVDLWSLGATLYTAVEGHRPFDRGEAMATLMAVVSEEPEPPKRAGPLEPVLRGLLTKDPARRSTVEQARRGLEAVLAGGPAAAEQPAAPGPRRARATHEAPAVLRAEDLRRLASASRAVLTTVVGEARDSAVAAAQRRRETSSQRRAEVAESRRELRRGVVRRVKHVVIGAVVVALLLVAGLVALVAHLVGAF